MNCKNTSLRCALLILFLFAQNVGISQETPWLADDNVRPDAPLTGRTAQTQDAVQEWMSGVSVVVLWLTGASPVAAATDGRPPAGA